MHVDGSRRLADAESHSLRPSVLSEWGVQEATLPIFHVVMSTVLPMGPHKQASNQYTTQDSFDIDSLEHAT